MFDEEFTPEDEYKKRSDYIFLKSYIKKVKFNERIFDEMIDIICGDKRKNLRINIVPLEDLDRQLSEGMRINYVE